MYLLPENEFLRKTVLIETYWNVNDDIHYLIDNDLI